MRAKILSAVVIPAVDHTLPAFGKAIGEKVGAMLAETRKNFELRLQQLRVGTSMDIEEATRGLANQDVDAMRGIGTSRCAEVIAEQATTSHGNSKNIARKVRRCRTKTKLTMQRQQLLQMRPASGIKDVDQVLVPDFHQRLSNLEIVVTTSAQFLATPYIWNPSTWNGQTECGPWQSAAPAILLAKQCCAAKRIQQLWRRRRDAPPFEPNDVTFEERECATGESTSEAVGEMSNNIHAETDTTTAVAPPYASTPETPVAFDSCTHENLLSTIRKDTFCQALASELSDVRPQKCSNGAAVISPSCLPTNGHGQLRRRADRAIKVVLEIDAWKGWTFVQLKGAPMFFALCAKLFQKAIKTTYACAYA